MKKNTQISSAFKGLLVAMIGVFTVSGCYIAGRSDESRDWWYYCDATGCYRCDEGGCENPGDPPGPGPSYCTRDQDCPSGTFCDVPSGYCVTPQSTCKVTAECSHGTVCLAGHCKPGKSPCDNDAACGSGAYCANGVCKDSGLCAKDGDCAAVGKDLVCDVRGSCVPAPPGPKACTDVAGCDAGDLCVDGRCGSCSGDCGGGKTCALAVHCGDGRACLDGQCVNTCQTKSDCGSAQVCVAQVCQMPPAGSCVKDADCGTGQVCANAVCYVDCTAKGSCQNAADTCSGEIVVGARRVRICTPNVAASPQCKLTKDCADSEQCVNGVCRTTCVKTEDCATCDDGPVCGKGGFCMTQDEVSPACTLNKDCGGDKICLDNQCI